MKQKVIGGKITDIVILIEKDKDIIKFTSLNKFLNSEYSKEKFWKDKSLVVWHPWMLEYISSNKKFKKFFDKIIRGRIIIFSDLYAMMDNFSKKKIQNS